MFRIVRTHNDKDIQDIADVEFLLKGIEGVNDKIQKFHDTLAAEANVINKNKDKFGREDYGYINLRQIKKLLLILNSDIMRMNDTFNKVKEYVSY